MPRATLDPAETLGTKGGRTRQAIVDAAARLFAERGYDGTGIRDIEAAAKVKRGVVTYHFGNKKAIWIAAFTFVFGSYIEDLRSRADLLRSLDPVTRRRVLVEQFIRTSARSPLMNQLMIQENFLRTWRTEWIIKHVLRPLRELGMDIAGDDPALAALESDPHLRYALLGACNMPFSLPCEVKALFGENVAEEAFVQKHIDTVTTLFEEWITQTKKRKGHS